MKWIRSIIVAALTVALVIVLNTKIGTIPPIGKFLDPFDGFWQNAGSRGFDLDENTRISGLKEAATVHYDTDRVPHIFAANDHDLYFLQGYVTARDRLWQMEMQTHAAAGRISEIVGKQTIEIDKYFRRLGMAYGARRSLAVMEQDPQMKMIMDAYTAGVNAYISSLREKDLPVEYKLLDYKPEPWSNYKIALLLKYMALNLSGYSSDIEFTNALHIFGKEFVDEFFPDFPRGIIPIIPSSKEYSFTAMPVDTPSAEELKDIWPMDVQKIYAPDEDNGSNNWAVSGKKTVSGAPILCSDPHLGLNLPSIWYTVQLSAPGINTFGVSIPGAPTVIIGFNENIAWGETNAERDVMDWYVMSFVDEERESYYFDNEIRATRREVEEIKVRGKATVLDTVIYTHIGPVVYDEHFTGDSSKLHLALQWMAHIGGNELKTFYLLNKGKNHEDYLEALDYYASPAQNFVFASRKGDIAIKQQGQFPVKWPEQGKYVSDGSKEVFTWQKYIPFEHNPHVVNPSQGYVLSANQHPTDSTYPYYYNGGYEHYRNRRIDAVLKEGEKITPEMMMQLQNDNYNLPAAELLPALLSHLKTDGLNSEQKHYLEILKNWDHFANADAPEQVIFEVWIDSLLAITFDELRLKKYKMPVPSRYILANLILNDPEHKIFDIAATHEREMAREVINISFEKAIAAISEWEKENKAHLTWGNYKDTRLTHLLRSITPFDVRNISTGGGKYIVNASKPDHGPSWRMVVELTDPVQAWGIYPGGQSGNPGSHYYSQYTDLWAEGRYLPLFFMKNSEDRMDKIVFTQNITPR